MCPAVGQVAGAAAGQGQQQQQLALFGAGDHLDFDAPLTLADRWAMGLRAAYLIAIFLPFMLLAPLLFGLCALLEAWDARTRPRLNGAAAPCVPPAIFACPMPWHGFRPRVGAVLTDVNK